MIEFIETEFAYAEEVMKDGGRQSYMWVLPYIRNTIISQMKDARLLSKDRRVLRKRVIYLEKRLPTEVPAAVRDFELEELAVLRKILRPYEGENQNA